MSGEQALRRAQQYGRNAPSPPATHRTRKVLGYLFSGFGPVLLVAAVLVFVAWKPLGKPAQAANLALAIVLVAIFAIQAGFNVWQDWSSARVMASIQALLPDACIVLRDGEQTSVAATAVVPGDVLLLRAGNKLPADVRFVDVAADTRLDRSVLTGESAPLPAAVASTDPNYLETRCIGLQGTHCVSGSAVAVAVAIGDNTVFGRIARLASEPRSGLTTLEREVFNFVAVICAVMAAMIVLVIVVWAAWLRRVHPGWIDVANLIISCVSVAVAFIPEGLPVALTASMTISANMMRKNRILCKSLKTVETLGSVSVICSDKTGTLTQNKMTVTECAVGGHAVLSADAARDALVVLRHEAAVAAESSDPSLLGGLASVSATALDQLRAVAGLCNDGEFDAATRDRPLAEQTVHGDATDQAVLRFSESLGPVSDLRRCWVSKFTLPFNSKNKYMIRALTMANKDGLSMALPSDIASVFTPHDM